MQRPELTSSDREVLSPFICSILIYIVSISSSDSGCSFMKLRLDRVLRLDLGSKSLAEAIESEGPVPAYQPLDRQGKWTAPYPPYRPGWWEVFMQNGKQ